MRKISRRKNSSGVISGPKFLADMNVQASRARKTCLRVVNGFRFSRHKQECVDEYRYKTKDRNEWEIIHQ